MKKKLFSIALFVVLISFTVAPLWGYSYISYATDEVESEDDTPQWDTSLSDDDKIIQGLTAYFNSRYGYLSGPVAGAYQVMKSFIINYNWLSNTWVGSKAEMAGYILVRNGPPFYQIRLLGKAVRAYNEIFDSLYDAGKFPDLESSQDGTSSDNLYTGQMVGDSLFYIVNLANANASGLSSSLKKLDSDSLISLGTPVDGVTGDYVYDLYMNSSAHGSFDPMNVNTPNGKGFTLPKINYSSNTSNSSTGVWGFKSFTNSGQTSYYGASLAPSICTDDGVFIFYANRDHIVRGYACWFIDRNEPTKLKYGYISHDFTAGDYWIYSLGYKTVSGSNAVTPSPVDTEVDFDTEGWVENEPTPEAESEIDYIPVEEDTGDTYNTYNEYYNDYSQKKTIIRNIVPDDPDPDPDPTPTPTPGGGSGTITPDGNGGYTFNLPDFQFPDLSNLNFNLSGLSEKFPFSIPFDLLAFFTVLNAPPETPELQGNIDLGLVNWEIDWDLHEFDNLAALLRTLEFIGFCIALALITRYIIKG